MIPCIFTISFILVGYNPLESDAYQPEGLSYGEIDIESYDVDSHAYHEVMSESDLLTHHRHLIFHPDSKLSDVAQRPFEISSEALFIYNRSDSKEMNDLLSDYSDDPAMKECLKVMKSSVCDPTNIYRTADGSCNNINHPRWGAAFSSLQRMLPANYIGEEDTRKSVRGGDLPMPKTVSSNIHFQVNKLARDYNTLYVNVGQFLAHDMSHSPVTMQRHKEQFNQLSSYLDGSQVYGSTEDEANSLRNFDDQGMLKHQRSEHGDLLPPSDHPENDLCSHPEENQICFKCGDDRCNQNPSLTYLQTLFLREHNNLVKKLQYMHPDWDGDTLYQEARRIVGAQLQVIAYKEYLPITLGLKLMRTWRLSINEDEPTTYEPRKNPTMYTEFTTAGFRFGHRIINTAIAKNWPSTDNEWMLRNFYFKPFLLYEDGLLDSFFQKVVHSRTQKNDQDLHHDMSEILGSSRHDSKEYGYDMESIDIKRGRDHGLPTYAQMVEFCTSGETKIRSWKGLDCSKKMARNTTDTLRKIYRDPRDIDLWTGLMSEHLAEGAVVGPTTACIIGSQFNNLKYGDRFYFEHADQVGSFTKEQREALKQVTLSGIICSNTNTKNITEKALLLPSDDNRVKDCSEIGSLDLSAWMDCKKK